MGNKELPAITGEVVVNNISFEEFLSRGMELRERADNLQWEFGDLAVEFVRICGPKLLPDLARGVGIAVNTLKRYCDVSETFPLATRMAYPMLSWSHFREVSKKEDKYLLLQRAHDENWSVEKLGVMAKDDRSDVIDDGKFVPPKPELRFDTNVRLWYIGNQNEDARYVRGNIKENTMAEVIKADS